jgi:hypothetical protein
MTVASKTDEAAKGRHSNWLVRKQGVTGFLVLRLMAIATSKALEAR